MYQQNSDQFTEQALSELTAFMEKMFPIKFEEDNSKFDMSVFYMPNWACIWNRPGNINKPCVILQKNSKIAVVYFDQEQNTQDVIPNVYRLEDLTPTKRCIEENS